MASSNAVNVTTADYTQGSTLSNTIVLPTTLEPGTYNLKFSYYISSPRVLTAINCDCGQLNVIGHCAKYNAPFTIEDITHAIDYLLDGTHPRLTINDVTSLIDALLES